MKIATLIAFLFMFMLAITAIDNAAGPNPDNEPFVNICNRPTAQQTC